MPTRTVKNHHNVIEGVSRGHFIEKHLHAFAIDAGQNSPAARDFDTHPRSGTPDIGADEFGNGTALQVPPPSNVIGTGADGALTAVRELLPGVEVEVFPNPASHFFTVKINGHETAPTLGLTSLDGRQMKTMIGHKISVEDLPSGPYLLTVQVGGGQVTLPVFILR